MRSSHSSKRGGVAAELDGVGVHLPNGIEHRMIVGIEDVFLELGVAGDVNLPDTMMRDVVQIIVGIEAVVFGRDVDVIYIEQDSAVGQFRDFAEKFPLGHRGLVKFRIAADIFHADGHLDEVAHATNIPGGILGHGPRIRHGQKIMGVAAIDAAPAKMIGEPRRLGALYQGLELFEMLAVRAVRGAEIHRDAVLDHAVLLEDFVEDLQRASAVAHEILRDDLEPIDDRFLFQNVPVMGHAKPDADTVIGEIIEGIGGHNILAFEEREPDKVSSRLPQAVRN